MDVDLLLPKTRNLVVDPVLKTVLKSKDSAPTLFQLKLKESMYINWEKPNLNFQVKHVNLTLTLHVSDYILAVHVLLVSC